jgi:hypothetical protein
MIFCSVFPFTIFSELTKHVLFCYGYEAWSVILKERLRVSEYRVFRRIFGCKRSKIKIKWRKVHEG